MLRRKKHIEQLTDEQLVAHYQKKHYSKYIGVLYERYYALVFGVCLKYLKSIEDSEDAVVVVFEKLIEDLKRASITNFSGWLYMVTKNYCLQQLRKRTYHLVDYTAIEEVLCEEEGLLLAKENEEQLFNLLASKIDELKEEQRICIQLFYLQKYSYTDIASLTGYELKKVKSYIQNGKRQLGILLQDDYQKLIGQTQ